LAIIIVSASAAQLARSIFAGRVEAFYRIGFNDRTISHRLAPEAVTGRA
jgi:hypothetical protein